MPSAHLPTILLPGLGIDATAWDEIKAYVPNAYATDRLDAYSPLSLEGQVNRLIEFMDARGIKRAQLVAHSMASFIGEAACRLHPERFSRLILVDGSYERRRKAWIPVSFERALPHGRLRATIKDWRCYGRWNNELFGMQRTHALHTPTVVIAAHRWWKGLWVRKLRQQARQLGAHFVTMQGSHLLMLDRPATLGRLIRHVPPDTDGGDGEHL